MRQTHDGMIGMVAYSSLAGNDGQSGPWDAASPATGKDVISVGSVDKFVVGPSPWVLANRRVNSLITLAQNATVLVNGEKAAPIVSVWFCFYPTDPD